MVPRISDLRIAQAMERGRIVGLPADDAQRIAVVAELVAACVTGGDLAFLFAGLGRTAQQTWRVPIDGRWTLAFEWDEGLGARDIRLE